MWGSKAFLSTELPLVSRISSRAANAAEEKLDLILFQSLMVSIDTRWTSSLAAVVEFITAGPSQPGPGQSRVNQCLGQVAMVTVTGLGGLSHWLGSGR